MTKLLIVDDNEQNLYMLQVLLEGHGYKVVSAGDGSEALEKARRDPPDVIVSDILMPVMDGFTLCREWRKDEQLKEIPFVFYTATYTDPKDEEFALSLGAEQFIVKPVEPDMFVEMLREVIEKHEAGRLVAPREPVVEEAVFFKKYNEALIRRLEDKMLQLEGANRALERDIAERVRAEGERALLVAQIREQARQMQQTMDTVPEGVLLLDADLRVLLANPAAKGDLAVLADASVGDTLTHLGDRPLAELLTSPPKGLWHEVATDGRSFEVIARPMENGPEPGGWVLVIRDVTQEREIQQRLQQQERLAAVGQLAAGIAHDFNNIMAVIVLYARMSLQVPDLPPRVHERLETIDRQAKRATDLIQQILDFSRRAVLERRPMDLVPFLKEVVKLLERTVPESIKMSLNYGVDEYTVNADPTRVQQVIMNLAVNARDAMPEGGELHIGLDRIRIEDRKRAPLPEMEAGEWVRLTVSDTGMGIPPDVRPHIFEPFFTTKERGEGTGLGLAQVHGIVKQHEGHIDVETEMGEGTTFTIYLPVLLVAQPEAPTLETQALTQGQGETVLVVEDNAAMREALVDTLELLNYRALEAANGREALEILERQTLEVSEDLPSLKIALVLSDVVMPEMGGIALFHALKQRYSAIRMVLLTGHPMEEELENLRAEGLTDWLPKPPSPEQLAQVLAQALREG